MRFSSVASLAAALAIGANAQTLPTITTKGSYFFTSTGSRWNVKGVYFLHSITTSTLLTPFPLQVSPTNSATATLSSTPPNAKLTPL